MKFDKLVESILNENAEVSINKQIADLLAQGIKVSSAVPGRVGEIISVNGNDVLIKDPFPRGRKGITSFDHGDKVKLQKGKSGGYIVTNVTE